MKLIVENKVPFIRPLVEPLFDEVVYLPDSEINAASTADADAVIGRTRTRCNRGMLEGSRVKFCATATIGLDHFDTEWLASQGITYANAPGCNAPAVAQWVFAAILSQIADPSGLTLGVVGEGHIGSIVTRWARSLGMNTLVCDPPKAESGAPGQYTGLDEIAHRADIITFHTPLTRTGRYATWHLADAGFFASLKRRPLVLNASRGAVVDNTALAEAIDSGKVSGAALDVWEGEPSLSVDLLRRVAVATPHIAGYSAEGKLRATLMVVEALRRHLGLDPGDASARVKPVPDTVTAEQIRQSYDIMADDAMLRSEPGRFEELRDSYTLRHEV